MTKAALRNPVAVLMVSLALVLLGGISLDRLPVDLFPKLSVPVIIIGTSFPGASPENVEQNITVPMERAVAQAWNVDTVTSSTRQGLSIVQVWFRWGSDIDAALLDVQQQVQAIGDTLPEHARPPMVVKFDLSSLPVSFVSVKGGGLDERALYDLAQNFIVPQLSSVPGVASATVSGGRVRQINVDLDPDTLRQIGLSLLDVEAAIRKANVVVPSGSLKSGRMDYDVFSNTQFRDIEELEEVVVDMVKGHAENQRRAGQIPIRVKDLGKVTDAHREQSQIVRVDGERAVYLKVYKQPGANTIETVEALRAKLPTLHNVPPGVELEATFDQSNYIKNAIRSLRHEAFLGTGLAMLVVLIFLATFSGTLIVGLSLPLSVLVTLVVLYLTGETLNVFTLGGLALSVGRLVDNAIIVLENIHRHQHEGKRPLQAALDGTREVAAPVLAATLTTVIVFTPVWFLTGISKYLFTPMGLTIGASMFASYAISLTVIPVLARKFAPKDRPARARGPLDRLSNEAFARVQRFLDRVDGSYGRSLERVMQNKTKLFVGVGLALAGSLVLATQLGADFFPPIDEGEFKISYRAPIGTRVEETEKIAERLEALIREEVPARHLRTVLTSVGAPKKGLRAMLASNSGPHAGTIRVELSAPQERTHGVEYYISRVRERAKQEFPGIALMLDPRGTVREIINFGYKAPIVVEARGFELNKGSALAAEIERALKAVPGLADVKSIRQDDYPNLQVTVDRQRAARFNITQDDVARVLLGSVFGNTSRPPFITDPNTGVNYEIITRLAERYRDDLKSLGEIALQHNGKPILLRSIADIRRAVGPVEMQRRDQERVAEVTANVSPGADVGSVSAAIRNKLQDIELPTGFSVALKGQSEEQEKSNKSLAIALALALCIVYMVMAAQFRSLLHPLIIMATVPLGLVGVFVALFITNTSFSSTSMMGIIMMVGIVVANGILLVSYANIQRDQGASPEESALAAGRVRLRPILMTSLAVIFGLIPMAIGGPGSETYAPLARAVMGGLLVSTGLTLFVIPVLYVMVERRFPQDLEQQRVDDAALDAA